MKKKLFKSFYIFIFLIVSNCGYKVVDSYGLYNLDIIEIKSSGDKRINFKIKNKLKFQSSQSNKNEVILELYTNKDKIVKEKNIKNEITKYQITATTKVKLTFLENNMNKEINVRSEGNYQVSNKYSTTLRNEKRLIDEIADNLALQINNKILLITNDF